MVSTYDFAVLGDQEPEGLLAAAVLARKGYSVVVFPSLLFGEESPSFSFPLVFPHQWGRYKLDDLLFRAGFFQLEDAGLVTTSFPYHVIRPKQRTLSYGVFEWPDALHGERKYRPSHNLKKPWTLFLLEHIRKWGVDVGNEMVACRSSLFGFHFSKNCRSKHCIINCIHGAKNLLEIPPAHAWLYWDQGMCSIDTLPEPLTEFSTLHLETRESSEQVRYLHVQRDPSLLQAQWSLGTWLPISKTDTWQELLQTSRQHLRKVIPFLPPESLLTLPSTEELIQKKNECYQKGQFECFLTLPARNKFYFWKNWLFHRKLFVVNPWLLPPRSRQASLQKVFKLLNDFDQKRKKAA